MAIFNGRPVADVYLGTSAKDTIYGNGGADILKGARNEDTIYGGDGDDFIFGQQHADVLYGGRGRDTFVYEARTESYGLNNTDTIMDFSRSQRDRIDISMIDANVAQGGDQMFVLGSGPGQGRVWTERVGVDLYVHADLGGNSYTGKDFTVILKNFGGSLSTADFIL